MTDAITKLREPAALGAAAFAALMTLAAVITLLFTSGGSFSDIAFSVTGNLLSFEVAAGIAIAVYLANHAGPALPKARLITLVALVTAGAAALFGLVSFFAGFGAQASGTGKFTYFLAGAGGAAVLGIAGWYTWLTWQTHAPARPAAPAAPAPGGWAPQQNQRPQGGGLPQQQPGGQPGQQGFGWKPGNAAEQTAYLPPQGGNNGPQTLQAQQSASGSYAVPPGGAHGAHAGAQQGGQPGQGGGERTQMIPPVPPTMQEYAPDPQPWQPGGAAQGGPRQQGGVPQPPPTRPMNPGEGQNQGQQNPEGPFGVGNWQ